ncbi:MAG: hypothetical protein GY952_14295 [Rhodobacteraceae bacterium]|nr:hypothetical protein [Paracoccaceae bacterium]
MLDTTSPESRPQAAGPAPDRPTGLALSRGLVLRRQVIRGGWDKVALTTRIRHPAGQALVRLCEGSGFFWC